MKNKKKIIFIVIGIIALVLTFMFAISYFKDNSRITISEKKWIGENKSSVINVGVINDVNIFGKDGEGVYFKFLNDLAKEYEFTINPVPFAYGNGTEGLTLSIKQQLANNDVVLFKDHYVLVSQNEDKITDPNTLNNLKIGTLNSDISNIKSYYPNLNLVGYTNNTILMDDLQGNDDIAYVIVSLNMFIDQILSNNYKIVYHFSDIPLYYTLSFVADDNLTSIMTKFSHKWLDEKFEQYYNEYLLNVFLQNLGIQEKDKDILTSKVYNYGLIDSPAFEIIMSGNYGGISSIYLKKFSDFSNVEFKYLSYKNTKALNRAITRGEIDLYFNYYNVNSNYTDIKTLFNTEIAVIVPEANNLVVNSLNSIKNKEIYVEENSNIYNYVKENNFNNITTYSSEKELLKLKNKDVVILLDDSSFNYYANYGLENFSLRYKTTVAKTYNYKLNGDATFNHLFSKFITFIDPNEIKYDGLYSYNQTRSSGMIFASIAKYTLYVIALGMIVLYLIYRSKKKVKISKKIRKEDKIKFIDMLTSLKNRNYLSENITGWNKNTIYPQAAVVVDLNNIKYINDTYGTNEGDNQIKSAANILIKTQLDNTDVIRTDGNEFLIYMVGYEEKRVVSYMRKLYKEFNHLPYEYGAAIGYSMRTDDLKTIDDAINEATLDMRTKKETRD